MSKENQTDPRKKIAPRILPWVLGAAMLVVYLITLNPWITLLNLQEAAKASGWVWQPQLSAPLTYLVTLPFHWMSPAKIPYAMNLFSAMCASLVLFLLARSVAILPQDRTEPQRERERSDFSFLTGWPSLIPPIVAVLFAGLQLTFWQHATSFTGEMFDLLLFALILWLLLEYRLDEKPWRLTTAALIYGAAMAETWAFVAFLPVFITAIIWLKRLEFFNFRFLSGMALFGLAGLSLLLLLPLHAKFTGINFSIWELLHPNLRADWMTISALGNGPFRHNLAEASLSTLLPVLLLSFRWSANFGDSSQLGSALANHMMHFVYAVFFGVCVWAAFEPPFAAGQLLGTPCLTLYYLAALAIGYYCGYFLLVFGRKPIPTRRNSRPNPLLPGPLMWICPLVVAGTLAVVAISLGILIYRNVPLIREANDTVLLKFAQASTQELPKGGAILLCDSDAPGQDQPLRALIVQAELAREGRSQDFVVVDTVSAGWVPYNRMLHAQHPDKWPLMSSDPGQTNKDFISPLRLYNEVVSLSKSNALCYLNPSYGYYFEHFYQEPHGLMYLMKPLPDSTLLPPALDAALISQNEAFWSSSIESFRPAVSKALEAADADQKVNIPNWVLMHLHPTPFVNPNAMVAGELCSRGLDYWGVRLQRAGQIKEAANRFTEAKEFNPDNIVADINLKFNQTLRSNTPAQIEQISSDQFGKYRDWNAVITANGPFDEISFCFENGEQLKQNGFIRQAVQEFARVRQLAPDNLQVRLELAQIYLFNHLPDPAMEALKEPLADPVRFGLDEKNATGINILAASVYFQKDDNAAGSRLLNQEVARHPNDDTLLGAVTQAFFMRGLYTNALQVIDGKLARSPDDIQWLFGKGYACIQIGAYSEAVVAMTRVLEIQTNNSSARFDRALAYLKTDQLGNARADYRELQSTYTNSFQVAYGLGDIAARQQDTNEAIRNFEIYLANAPTNSLEYTNVIERLSHLRGK